MMVLAIPLAASSGVARSLDGDRESHAGSIHPDCVDDHQPHQCTRVVEELAEELDRFNSAFNPPDADQLAAFYHESAVLYVGSAGRFFQGRDAIRNDFFAPLVGGINGATVDVSAFRYRVINPNHIILYGSPTEVVTFKDGTRLRCRPCRNADMGSKWR